MTTSTSIRKLRQRVAIEGLRSIDKRTLGFRAVTNWRRSLATDLGGEENLSEQRKVLLDNVMISKLFLDHIDAFLLRQKSLVRKNRSIIPLVMQRMSIAAQLEKTLCLLGLDRQAKRIEDLTSYVNRKYSAPAQAAPKETIDK